MCFRLLMPNYAFGLIPVVQVKPYNYQNPNFPGFKKILTITNGYIFFGHFGIPLALTKCRHTGGDRFAEKNPIHYPDIALAYRHVLHLCRRCCRDTFRGKNS